MDVFEVITANGDLVVVLHGDGICGKGVDVV